MTKTIDRRLKINFATLNEEQENKVVSSLMDFLVWYKENEEEVNKSIQKSGKEVDDTSIVEFWIQNIGKSEEIEDYLNNMNVVADCYEYVRKYKKMILTLKEYPEKWVFTKNHYRTKEQADEMKKLLTEMKDHPEVVKIINYLNSHCMDIDHISSDYAERIIKKCRYLKRVI